MCSWKAELETRLSPAISKQMFFSIFSLLCILKHEREARSSWVEDSAISGIITLSDRQRQIPAKTSSYFLEHQSRHYQYSTPTSASQPSSLFLLHTTCTSGLCFRSKGAKDHPSYVHTYTSPSVLFLHILFSQKIPGLNFFGFVTVSLFYSSN